MLKDLMSHKELNELSYMRIFINGYKELFTTCGQAISTVFKALIVAVLVCLVLLLMPIWLLCDFISVSYSKYKADMEDA